MKGYVNEAIFAKFGLSAREMYYEESEKRCYLQFVAGNELYLASYIKGGSSVNIYKLEKAVNLDD